MFVKVFEARLIIINKYKIYHCDPQVHRYESLAIVDVRSWDNGMCYFILFYDALCLPSHWVYFIMIFCDKLKYYKAMFNSLWPGDAI